MDDVINVTGHRLGTAEVEDAIVSIIFFFIFPLIKHCILTFFFDRLEE